VRTLPMLLAAFARMGFAACEATLDGASRDAGRRLLGVVTAAREPLRRLPGPRGVPWPEAHGRPSPLRPPKGKPGRSGASFRVSDGTRTRDRLDQTRP
jgi:hypothetical protein